MMVIKCHVCGGDPAGRWVKPPASVFVDRYQASGALRADPVYACRAHLSAKREEEIQTRERGLGWALR